MINAGRGGRILGEKSGSTQLEGRFKRRNHVQVTTERGEEVSRTETTFQPAGCLIENGRAGVRQDMGKGRSRLMRNIERLPIPPGGKTVVDTMRRSNRRQNERDRRRSARRISRYAQGDGPP